MTRRQRLSTRMAGLLNSLLGVNSSWSAEVQGARGLDGRNVWWFLSAQRSGESLTLLETVSSGENASRLVYAWVLSPAAEDDGLWDVLSAEKNHEPLESAWINEELEEAVGRLEDPQTSRSFLEIPKARTEIPPVPAPGRWLLARRFREISGLAFFLLGFLLLAGFSSLQYHRMIQLVDGLNGLISLSSAGINRSVSAMEERIGALQDEVAVLRQDVRRERGAFEFSRKHTAMDIRSQAEALPAREFSRKRAYNYLADRVESAASYQEILREISRLPGDNAQAETVMAVDRANIVTLDSFRPAVPGLTYPVRMDGRAADGKDFMISSGYGEIRPSTPGGGGYRPHLGVDIINVSNILTVTTGNSIVRYPGEPGSVVAAAAGEVVHQGFNSVYGWFMEIRHELRPEWISHYRGIEALTTYYAHLQEDSGLRTGTRIGMSEKLGKIGSSGQVTGPHLHFEVRVYRAGGAFTGTLGSFDRVNPYLPQQ